MLPTSNSNEQHRTKQLGWYKRLKKAAKALKREVLAVYYATQDKRTPFYAKLIPFLVLAYALSPIDLIPDFIPVLGILDDVILVPMMIALAIKVMPNQVMEDARQRAEQEPLRLSRNWCMAVAIFALWMALVLWGVQLACDKYGNDLVHQYQLFILGGVLALGLITFIIWFIFALRKERRKRASAAGKRAHKHGGAAASEGGLDAPLLADVDAGATTVIIGAVASFPEAQSHVGPEDLEQQRQKQKQAPVVDASDSQASTPELVIV